MAQSNNSLRVYGRAEVRSAYIRTMCAIVGVANYDPTDDVFLDVIDNRIDALLARRAALPTTGEMAERQAPPPDMPVTPAASGANPFAAGPIERTRIPDAPQPELTASAPITGDVTRDSADEPTAEERDAAARAAGTFPDSGTTGVKPFGPDPEDDPSTP